MLARVRHQGNGKKFPLCLWCNALLRVVTRNRAGSARLAACSSPNFADHPPFSLPFRLRHGAEAIRRPPVHHHSVQRPTGRHRPGVDGRRRPHTRAGRFFAGPGRADLAHPQSRLRPAGALAKATPHAQASPPALEDADGERRGAAEAARTSSPTTAAARDEPAASLSATSSTSPTSAPMTPPGIAPLGRRRRSSPPTTRRAPSRLRWAYRRF